MKAIKFIVAACLVLIGVGVAGTGVTLGQMYKSNQMNFEIKDQKDLKVTALEKVYINSDVPVRIMPTDGKAYVTFDASGNGVIFPEPKYELQVTSEGTSSHVNLKQIQDSEIYFFSSNWDEELVVYLPAKDIDTLEVKINEGNYYRNDSVTFSSSTNIKNLKIDAQMIDLALNGSYNSIDIGASRGNIDIFSKTPAQVKLSHGGAKTVLRGQIATANITNERGGDHSDIIINSDLEAKVNIDVDYGKTQIDGKLSELTVDSYSNEIDVNSATPYNVNISSSESTDIQLKGMIQNAIIEGGHGGQVKLYPTGTPKRIEILGESMDVHAVLPKDISGFEIKKRVQYEDVVYEEDYNDYNHNNEAEVTIQEEPIYMEQNLGDTNSIYIDFKVKSENLNNGLKRIYYGDEAMKMFIGATYGSVYITK